MPCKICDGTPVFDLICEKCGSVAAQLCGGPMCQFDLWRNRPNDVPSVIPLMNGKCTCGGNLNQVEAGAKKWAFRFNTSKKPVFRTGYHKVEECNREQIVQAAKALRIAWEDEAKRKRGKEWGSPETAAHECSTAKWDQIDEGMDVAGAIEKNDENDNATFWWVKEYGSDQVIGVLVLDKEDEVTNDLTNASEIRFPKNGFWSGIRKIVGHPHAKGAGEALMAKVDEIHRKSRQKYMTVIAAMSAAKWYMDRGFHPIGLSDCNDEGQACGCVIMIKPAIDQMDL
jgi:hypothetical protein